MSNKVSQSKYITKHNSSDETYFNLHSYNLIFVLISNQTYTRNIIIHLEYHIEGFIISNYNHTHKNDHRYTRKIISMVSSRNVVYVIIEKRRNESLHRMDNTHINHTMATTVTFTR